MNSVILHDLNAAFGLRVDACEPVSGGWLNKKWKISTGAGDLLVKQFSPERFSRRKLEEIEQALRRQIILHGEGVPCPRIYEYGGQVIRFLPNDTAYMIMQFVPGRTGSPETVCTVQMESLGEACAKMHNGFARICTDGVKNRSMQPGDVISSLRAALRTSAALPGPDVPEAFREAIGSALNLLPCLPKEFPGSLPMQLAHEDFAADNLLFHEDRLSAIVDFDRNQYSFPLHDIGRVLLSLTLKDGVLNDPLIRAFVAGYRRFRPLAAKDIFSALLLTWIIEVPWWLRPEFFSHPDAKPARFKEEILFMTGLLHANKDAFGLTS